MRADKPKRIKAKKVIDFVVGLYIGFSIGLVIFNIILFGMGVGSLV